MLSSRVVPLFTHFYPFILTLLQRSAWPQFPRWCESSPLCHHGTCHMIGIIPLGLFLSVNYKYKGQSHNLSTFVSPASSQVCALLGWQYILVHWIELSVPCPFLNSQEVTCTLLPGIIPTQECSHPRPAINGMDDDDDDSKSDHYSNLHCDYRFSIFT